MTLRAGKMRVRIDIQARDLAPMPTGEQGSTWTSVVGGGVWCEANPMLGGQEIVLAQQQQGRMPIRFRVRWMRGFTDALRPRMRVVGLRPTSWANRWFDVTSIQQVDGIPHELVIVAVELVEEAL